MSTHIQYSHTICMSQNVCTYTHQTHVYQNTFTSPKTQMSDPHTCVHTYTPGKSTTPVHVHQTWTPGTCIHMHTYTHWTLPSCTDMHMHTKHACAHTQWPVWRHQCSFQSSQTTRAEKNLRGHPGKACMRRHLAQSLALSRHKATNPPPDCFCTWRMSVSTH
jgi:hypothetical protein